MNDDVLDQLLNNDNQEAAIFKLENEKLAPLLAEINLIQDLSIRYFVRAILMSVAHFWTIPASFSGNHHPPDERGVGGNVIHTRRVVRAVILLGEAQDRSILDMDFLIAAALLHDTTKGIEWSEGNVGYDPMHAYTVDRLVNLIRWASEATAPEEPSHPNRVPEEEMELDDSSLVIDEEFVQQILRLVRTHMGRWSPVLETMPVSVLEWTLHLADNIASKLHLLIDGEDIKEERWILPQ